MLLTRSPLVYPRKGLTVRLACVKHTASVRPEPGSNSPSKKQKSDTPKNTGAPKNNSTENPITNKPPQHTQPNAHTAEENQSKEKTRNKPKKQSLVHPQKNGIDLKHAVEFSRFGSHQSSNPVNLIRLVLDRQIEARFSFLISLRLTGARSS